MCANIYIFSGVTVTNTKNNKHADLSFSSAELTEATKVSILKDFIDQKGFSKIQDIDIELIESIQLSRAPDAYLEYVKNQIKGFITEDSFQIFCKSDFDKATASLLFPAEVITTELEIDKDKLSQGRTVHYNLFYEQIQDIHKYDLLVSENTIIHNIFGENKTCRESYLTLQLYSAKDPALFSHTINECFNLAVNKHAIQIHNLHLKESIKENIDKIRNLKNLNAYDFFTYQFKIFQKLPNKLTLAQIKACKDILEKIYIFDYEDVGIALLIIDIIFPVLNNKKCFSIFNLPISILSKTAIEGLVQGKYTKPKLVNYTRQTINFLLSNKIADILTYSVDENRQSTIPHSLIQSGGKHINKKIEYRNIVQKKLQGELPAINKSMPNQIFFTSFSKIISNPFIYYLNKIEGIQDPDIVYDKASRSGLAMHKIAEIIISKLTSGQDIKGIMSEKSQIISTVQSSDFNIINIAQLALKFDLILEFISSKSQQGYDLFSEKTISRTVKTSDNQTCEIKCIVDLMCVKNDEAEIIDFKSSKNSISSNEQKAKKPQLSVAAFVASERYKVTKISYASPDLETNSIYESSCEESNIQNLIDHAEKNIIDIIEKIYKEKNFDFFNKLFTNNSSDNIDSFTILRNKNIL